MIDAMKEMDFQLEHIQAAVIKVQIIFDEVRQGRLSEESAKKRIAEYSHKMVSYAHNMSREAASDNALEAAAVGVKQ